MTVEYATIENIAAEARPYPTYLLENAKTGLCLFSAAFMGHNDVIHFALENMHATCVDVDGGRLKVMANLYPEDWTFVEQDAWDFAAKAAESKATWDIVSVDTFRGNATEKSLANLQVWCDIADIAVIATLEIGQNPRIPDGWHSDLFQRNSEVFWLVLTRSTLKPRRRLTRPLKPSK